MRFRTDPQIWQALVSGFSRTPDLEAAWLRKTQEIYEMFVSKQRDYGTTNIGLLGYPGLVARLADKMSRIVNLHKTNSAAANESVRDSLIDLADYAIIALMVLDGDWPNHEPEEVWQLEGEDA